MKNKHTLIIGASENPERYAFKAAKMLKDHDHTISLLGKAEGTVAGARINTKPQKFENIDTVTLYINPEHQKNMEDYIISLKPKRVIFNPGTENNAFAQKLNGENIHTEEACTLVLLSTNQY